VLGVHPVVAPASRPRPTLLFTYMSHISPRIIANEADVTMVNSMHGVTLNEDAPDALRATLPILACNSVTRLGAEVRGRAYGGGILKMEPNRHAH
jgi:adenine-specific DNA-methyltransferase